MKDSVKDRMEEKEHNPNLEGYRKCPKCQRLYDITAYHGCRFSKKINPTDVPRPLESRA